MNAAEAKELAQHWREHGQMRARLRITVEHADAVLTALLAGKAPPSPPALALDWDELDAVEFYADTMRDVMRKRGRR